MSSEVAEWERVKAVVWWWWQGVVKRDLPDVRLYFGSAAASVRFLSDAAAAGVAGAADDMTHNVRRGRATLLRIPPTARVETILSTSSVHLALTHPHN